MTQERKERRDPDRTRPVLPDVAVIADNIDAIRSLVSRPIPRLNDELTLSDAVRWGMNQAHLSYRMPRQEGEGKPRGSDADPTGNLVASRARIRFHMSGVHQDIDHALKLLSSAVGHLYAIDKERQDGASGLSKPYPYHRGINDQEREESKAAQRRRMERGEGWGVG